MRLTFLAATAAVAAIAGPAHAATYAVGDRVEAFNVSWYPATITEVGSGGYAGYYKVRYDGFAQEQFLKADSIRPLRIAPAPTAAAPRDGKYVCMGYNGGTGMFRFYLTIRGRTYQQSVPNLAPGAFTYSAANKTLTFTSGPYPRNNWIGLFSVDRGGKTHKIVLRDRAKQAQGPRVGEYSNIYCNNSTDS